MRVHRTIKEHPFRAEALLQVPWIEQDPDVFTFEVWCLEGRVLVDRQTLLLHSTFFREHPPDEDEVVVGRLMSLESLRRGLATWYGLPLQVDSAVQLVEILEAADFLGDRGLTGKALEFLQHHPIGRVQEIWSLVTARWKGVWLRPCVTWIAGHIFEMLYRCWNQPDLKPGPCDLYGDWRALVELPFCDCIRRWTGQTSLEAFATVVDAEPFVIPHLLRFQTPATPHMRHLCRLHDF